MFRIGYGNDVHRLATGRKLILGGVLVAEDRGADGHSDADALTHAITDAIFGALAEGDIGTHFSDGEERWKNAESFVFLRYAVGLAKEKGFTIENVDSTIDLERPKLRPFIDRMREGLAVVLEVEIDRVSVKAKTGEGLGPVGTQAAVTAQAVVLLRQAA
jgi:2-C-methyl-D-erythritol 2,4-cyclodiphosphate synthase